MRNFSNYIIDVENGRLFSKKSNRYVGHKDKDGYIQVSLYGDDKKVYCFLLHRLIWMEVNGQIPSGYEVDHLNTIRDDNRISNLRLVTRKENCNNPLTLQHKSEARKRAVAKLDKVTEEVLEIQPYMTKYTELYGFSNRNISSCCRGKRPSAYGYKWKYAA